MPILILYFLNIIKPIPTLIHNRTRKCVNGTHLLLYTTYYYPPPPPPHRNRKNHQLKLLFDQKKQNKTEPKTKNHKNMLRSIHTPAM